MAGPTWHSDTPADAYKITAAGWLRVGLRGLCLGAVVFGGLLILLLVRMIERPVCGLGRPVTPYITQTVCRMAFVILGMKRLVRGAPMRERGAVVANHVSWLDIFALNSVKRFYFVSKSEVARWPGIGWLARATGTVFIDRDPKRAKAQTQQFQDRLLAGHKLLFFPEGTSTDGQQVLPFKTTLFQAFMTPELQDKLFIQPVTLIYHAPLGQAAHFYGWWGDMDFGSHMLKTLAAFPQGSVELVYHDPVRVNAYANRKELAADLEQRVRAGHTPHELR
jgi:1-acyl-sn-glycerol-3-phosphate acyltransferase